MLGDVRRSSCLDPNGFSSALLKKLGSPLIKPLCVLFSFAFNSGEIPDDWRLANIMPIFKKGSFGSLWFSWQTAGSYDCIFVS